MGNAAHWSTLAVADFRDESSALKKREVLGEEEDGRSMATGQIRRAHSVRRADDNHWKPGHSRTASSNAESSSRDCPSHDVALPSPDVVSSARPIAAGAETGQYSRLEHLRVKTPLRLPTSDKRRRQGRSQRTALSVDEAGSKRTSSTSTASSTSTSASASTANPPSLSRTISRRTTSENVDRTVVKRLQITDPDCKSSNSHSKDANTHDTQEKGASNSDTDISTGSRGARHGWPSEAIAIFPDNENPTSIRNRIIGSTTTPTPTTTNNIVAAGDSDTSQSPHTTTRHATAVAAEDTVCGDPSEGSNHGGSGTINSIAALALSLSLPPTTPAAPTTSATTPVLSNKKSLSSLSSFSSPSCPSSSVATETRERAASNKRVPPAPIHVDRLGESQEDLGGLSTPSHRQREQTPRGDHHRLASQGLERSPLNPRYGYDYSLLWDPSKASTSHVRHSSNKSSPSVTSPLWHSSGPTSAQQQPCFFSSSSSQLPPTPQSPPIAGLAATAPPPPTATSPLPSPSPSTSSSAKDRHHSHYYNHYANSAGLGPLHSDGSTSTPLSPGRAATHHKPKANSPAVTSFPADSKHQYNYLPPTPSLSSSSSSPRSFLFHPFRHATANMTHDEISFKYPPSYRNDSVSSASATTHSNNTAGGLMASSDTLPPSSAEGSVSASNVSTSTKPSSTVGPKPLIIRNNRTYIQDPTLTYPLPVDLAELHRQSLRTLLLFQLFGGPITSPAFSAKPPARVLEVGCGTGFWSMMCHRYFAQHGHGSISFTGIDIVPLCGSGLDPNSKPDKDMRWRFIQHDMRRTPWPVEAGEFDLVMVKDMSFATPSGRTYQNFMDEYLRVLRPGGVLEIWDADHTIRMLRPHAPTSQSKGAIAEETSDSDSNSDSNSDEESESESDADEEDQVSRFGAYIITANTPLSTPLNPFLVEYNGWLSKALEKCTISSVPCTHTGPSLLQEDGLSDVRSKRLAIPLSEVRWEREGVGGVVTKDGKSYIDSMKGKGKMGDAKSIRGGGKSLSQQQAAVRRTALETVVGMIQALEPLLREISGKSQDEWDGWAGKMINDLLKEGGTSWGECLEVGAWTARKRK